MSTTKTKNPYASSVEELSLNERAIQDSAAALQKAKEDSEKAQKALQSAAEDLRDIRAGISSGRIDPETDPLTKADNRYEACSLAAAGADRRLSQVRNQLAVTDLDFLSAVEEPIKGIFSGKVETYFTTGPVPSDLSSLPVPSLLIVQERAHGPARNGHGQVDPAGGLSGDISILFVRDELHTHLDGQRIVDAFAHHVDDIPVKIQSETSGDTRDLIKVKVLLAYPEIPNIRREPSTGASWPSGVGYLQRMVQDCNRGHRFGERFDYRTGDMESGVVLERGAAKATIAEVSSAKGIRSTIVEVHGTVTSSEGHAPAIANALDVEAKKLEGRITDLGRISEAEVTTSIPDPGKGVLYLKMGLTMESREA